MGYHQIITDKNGKEMNMPLDESFPVWGLHDDLNNYVHQHFLTHWHPEIEVSLIKKGEIQYTLQDQSILLKQGDALFINSNTLHGGSKIKGNCELFVLRMEPTILGHREGKIYQKYVAPLILCNTLPYVKLSQDSIWQKELIQIMQLISTHFPNTTSWLTLLSLLSSFWEILYDHVVDELTPMIGTNHEVERVQLMCSYIQSNLYQKITLDDLAKQASICKSECCRLFKEYVHQTPIQYINTCRIHQSLSYVAQGDHSLTEIAQRFGFMSSSYYTETFHKIIGMTPRAYHTACHSKDMK